MLQQSKVACMHVKWMSSPRTCPPHCYMMLIEARQAIIAAAKVGLSQADNKQVSMVQPAICNVD